MHPLKMIYYGLLGLCLIALLFNIRKLGKTYLWFVPLIILALVVQIVDDLLKYYDCPRYFLFHIYQPIELLLLSIFYSHTLKGKYARACLLIANVCMIGFVVIYYTMIHPAEFYKASFPEFSLQSVFMCFFVICFFVQILKVNEVLDLKRYPAFWINAGNLIFYGGCLLVMGLNLYLEKSAPTLASKVISLNYYLNLCLYLFYLYAFLCLKNLTISQLKS
jgi:hypothetical protein